MSSINRSNLSYKSGLVAACALTGPIVSGKPLSVASSQTDVATVRKEAGNTSASNWSEPSNRSFGDTGNSTSGVESSAIAVTETPTATAVVQEILSAELSDGNVTILNDKEAAVELSKRDNITVPLDDVAINQILQELAEMHSDNQELRDLVIAGQERADKTGSVLKGLAGFIVAVEAFRVLKFLTGNPVIVQKVQPLVITY